MKFDIYGAIADESANGCAIVSSKQLETYYIVNVYAVPPSIQSIFLLIVPYEFYTSSSHLC